MKKKSYFNNGSLDIDEPYDLDKWNYLSKMIIYDSQRLGKHKALDYHSYVNIEDPTEQRKFKLWHKEKTASGENMNKLKKTALEQYGLPPGKNYSGNVSPYDEKDDNIAEAARLKRKMQYEKMHGKIPEEKTDMDEAKERKALLSKNLIKYVSLIQRSLLSSDDIDLETFQAALEALNNLSTTVKKIKTAEMGIDLMIRTSNKLNNLGLSKEASGMRKFAQQQEEAVGAAPIQEESVVAPQDPAAPVEQPVPEEPQAPRTQEEVLETALEGSKDAQSVDYSDIETPGPEEGEYDKVIDQDVNIHDAAGKLEDVAGMLADRRVIRYLAEFDIMLDKLGIASMFPELAESQSKLIDAYSYALTRVSKMMGQLSNAADILKGMEGNVPGSNKDAE